MKKALSIVLAVVILLGVLSLTAFAEDEAAAVTEIYNVEDLYMVNFALDGSYKLMNDIDLTEVTAEGGDWDYDGRGWEPIGSNGIYSGNTPFTGTFDGNGYEIKGLRIDLKNNPSGIGNAYVGLFANNTGTIKNLSVSGSIQSSVSATYSVGAIAGYNSGTIECCTNNASIHANSSKNSYRYLYVGGIVGYANKSSVITKCDNSGSITGSNSYYYIVVGGIAGYSEGAISECHNSGSSTATNYTSYTSSNNYSSASSGIACGGTISNCYNTGNISASGYYQKAGGICASTDGTITNSYNTGTAMKAISYGTVTDCYFLSGSGADTTGAKSLTSAQMKLKAMYRGFDFDDIWFIDSTGEYPYPQLRNNAAYPIEEPTEPETEEPTDEQTNTPTEDHTEESTATDTKVYLVGDADNNGKVDIVDATFIQRYATDIATPYPIGEPINILITD